VIALDRKGLIGDPAVWAIMGGRRSPAPLVSRLCSSRSAINNWAQKRWFITAKDLVVEEQPCAEDGRNAATNKLNLFSAVNQALLTVLESDPK
jgi:hypothetical protein